MRVNKPFYRGPQHRNQGFNYLMLITTKWVYNNKNINHGKTNVVNGGMVINAQVNGGII